MTRWQVRSSFDQEPKALNKQPFHKTIPEKAIKHGRKANRRKQLALIHNHGPKMEYLAMILVCGRFADNMLTKAKMNELVERIKDLENTGSNA
jgi:hypothetical protein